jgi:2,3-bisphosphoglycerate-independent phosphoglycerate mutase
MSEKIAEKKKDLNLFFVTMTQYDPRIDSKVAYSPANIETTLAKEISKAGLSQVHIAETEKFAHATYYFNGGKQDPYEKESHVLIESRKDVKTHDLAPEMKAKEIAEKAVEFIKDKTPFIFLNFANPDMIGHTGNKTALVKALEVVDKNLEKVVSEALKNDAIVFIAADHGNAEISVDENGLPHTAHTTSEVPAILVGAGDAKLQNGCLTDIAPTILKLLKIAQPKSMTGKSLLVQQ